MPWEPPGHCSPPAESKGDEDDSEDEEEGGSGGDVGGVRLSLQVDAALGLLGQGGEVWAIYAIV